MHIEKINDRQVRVVLTKQDLAAHKLVMSELRYGSRETSELFREVLEEAADRYGFNEEELPVMIEAVPMNNEELLVIISAVEDAEELDPHFAKFSEVETDPRTDRGPAVFLGTDEDSMGPHVAMFAFREIDDLVAFCRHAATAPVMSELFRRERGGGFYLALHRPSNLPPRDFNAFLNSLLEFGNLVPASGAIYAGLREHQTPVMQDVLETLGKM